jgi:ADP-heptose:LPS heptosyltransferase
MKTNITGSGGLGDSVILSAKLMNIVRYILPGHRIHYKHFEAEKRAYYKPLLEEYWELVKQTLQNYEISLIYQVINYPNGKFWEVVPKAVFNTSTALTTQVDGLCHNIPPMIVKPIQSDSVVLVADGGNGARGITKKCLRELADYFKKITILGKKVSNNFAKSTDSKIEDLRGQTTLTEALGYILGAKLVIAPDGILGYFAFIYNVPNILLFHEPQLIQAYWSPNLNRNSFAYYAGGFIDKAERIISALTQLPKKI